MFGLNSFIKKDKYLYQKVVLNLNIIIFFNKKYRYLFYVSLSYTHIASL